MKFKSLFQLHFVKSARDSNLGFSFRSFSIALIIPSLFSAEVVITTTSDMVLIIRSVCTELLAISKTNCSSLKFSISASDNDNVNGGSYKKLAGEISCV